MDGETNNTGRLEICYDGEWGAVCDDLFNNRAAAVACRELGFEGRSCKYTIDMMSHSDRSRGGLVVGVSDSVSNY